jgi:hypothetical protein
MYERLAGMSWVTVEAWLTRSFVDVCELLIMWPRLFAESAEETADGQIRFVRSVSSPGQRKQHQIAVCADPLRIMNTRRAMLQARWRSVRGPFGAGSGRALLQLDAMARRESRTGLVITIERRRRSVPPWGLTTRAFNSLAYEECRQIPRTIDHALQHGQVFDNDRWLYRLQSGGVEGIAR